MVEDADAKQAKMLAGMLRDAITEIASQLEEPRRRNMTARDQRERAKRDADLRAQLHEARRLLDRLYRRFPELTQAARPSGGPVRCGVRPGAAPRVIQRTVPTR